MGDMSKEPSMEDILSSIRRVIEREDAARVGDEAPAAADIVKATEEPLELTQASEFHESLDDYPTDTAASGSGETDDDTAILSSDAVAASRRTFASLSQLGGDAPAPATTAPTTIDDLVRESLRPMLKAWLDEHLPIVVETIVTREVERITQRDT